MTKIGGDPRPAPRSPCDEGCIAAHALDLLGDRWALLVIRELLLGPKRFSVIRAGLPGISATILTRRLQDLAAGGVLVRRVLAAPVSVQLYALTRPGLSVRPVIEALCRWGAKAPGHDPRKFISPTALMLSMTVMIDGARAADMALTAGFRLGAEAFSAVPGDGRLTVSASETAQGAPIFAGSANAVAAAVYGPQPLAEALAGGQVGFAGDPLAGQRFVDLFSLRRGG